MVAKVKEEVNLIRYDQLSKQGMLAPSIRRYILEMGKMGLSLNAIRVILILSFNLREKHLKFRGKNSSNQLTLFDDDWFDIDNNNSMSVQFNFRFSDFLPKGNKNYAQVKKGIHEIQDKQYIVEWEILDKNGQLKKYTLKSALITQSIMNSDKGLKIVINNFWYKALIDVSKSYDFVIKPVIFNLSHNGMLLYFYLKSLPKIKTLNIDTFSEVGKEFGLDNTILPICRGTKIKKENFLEIFGNDYKNKYQFDSHIKRDLLDSKRAEMNNYADISFGYKFDGKGNIILVSYEIISNQVENKLMTTEEGKIKSAVAYKYKNKKLTDIDAVFLLEIYIKYTYDVVFKATDRKTALKKLAGREYIECFLKLVEDYVQSKNIDLSKIDYKNTQEMRKKLSQSYIKRHQKKEGII